MLSNQPWRLFWAKTYPVKGERREDAEKTHPLWAHLCDVACTSRVLWDVYLSCHLRRILSAAVGLSEKDAGQFYSLILGLHDVGKGIPPFQIGHRPSRRRLHAAGLQTKAQYPKQGRIHHGHATIPLLLRWVSGRKESGKLSDNAAALIESLAAYTGFHHGRFCFKRDWEANLKPVSSNPCGGNDPAWYQAQQDLIEAVVAAWGLPVLDSVPDQTAEWPSWLLGYLGWSTTADWLGSMGEYMPHDINADGDLRSYIDGPGMDAAIKAVERCGFTLRASLHAPGFLGVFGAKIAKPRAIQTYLEHLPLPEDEAPTLTLVEAPTGEGKTEAAFYLAARQQARYAPGGGIYMAMPTQAMSNAQFVRMRDDFLANAHDVSSGGEINYRLVHGNDDLHVDQQQMLAEGVRWADNYGNDGEADGTMDDGQVRRARAITTEWFMPRKRSLLAPYGVGTVDQTFLAVLNAKHSYLRLFGLSGKTVIFDEIHAYDTYMDLLFEHTLRWLKEMGAHVILLSATLPSAKREKFLEAWGTANIEEHHQVGYPAIWSVAKGICEVKHGESLEPAWKQDARLEWLDSNPETVARKIIEIADRGATVGVILNTVDRAQKVYRLLRDHESQEWEELILFHARFEYQNRSEIESNVRTQFGPDRERAACRPRILIATQVAEQSLDLDFDVLFSDIAPIDLLLQRAGRLHRHFYDPGHRPAPYTNPHIYVLCPMTEPGRLPQLGSVASVYDSIVVWKTWRLLNSRSVISADSDHTMEWSLPNDYRPFIEEVYDPLTMKKPPTDLSEEDEKRWKRAWQDVVKDDQKASGTAETQLIPRPENLVSVVTYNNTQRVEDDDVMPYMKAMTRLGDSVDVVCLHVGPDGALYFDIDLTVPVEMACLLQQDNVGRSDWERFLYNSLRLSKEPLPRLLRQQKDHPSNDYERDWNALGEKAGALRYRRLLLFQDGKWMHPEFTGSIIYSKELGLIFNSSTEEQ